jgi:hypothetical protein
MPSGISNPSVSRFSGLLWYSSRTSRTLVPELIAGASQGSIAGSSVEESVDAQVVMAHELLSCTAVQDVQDVEVQLIAFYPVTDLIQRSLIPACNAHGLDVSIPDQIPGHRGAYLSGSSENKKSQTLTVPNNRLSALKKMS